MSDPENVRILMMEDDPGLARLCEKRLTRLGYIVDIARNGQEGLDMYEQGNYDLLLMDQVMPLLTGLQVFRSLLSQGPLPPAIMVTGTGSEPIAVEAMKLGASDYLVKDVDRGYLDLLPTVIEKALRQHDLAQEKQEAEEALRERERQLSTLFDNLPGIAYRCQNDPEWTMEFLSKGCQPLTGYQAEALLHNRIRSYAQIIHPEDRHSVWEKTQDAIQAGHSFQMEYRIVTAEGQVKWVWEQGSAVCDQEGCIQAIEGFITDISERKRAEEEREQLVVNLQEALDQVQTLRGLLPICANCKKIRDDSGYWHTVEAYVAQHSDVRFSHGICPECMKELYPWFKLNE